MSSVLSNTSIYINGYLRGTTDIEMKRVIAEAGGQVLFVRGHCPLHNPLKMTGLQTIGF